MLNEGHLVVVFREQETVGDAEGDEVAPLRMLHLSQISSQETEVELKGKISFFKNYFQTQHSNNLSLSTSSFQSIKDLGSDFQEPSCLFLD